jgi:hypothetical protein
VRMFFEYYNIVESVILSVICFSVIHYLAQRRPHRLLHYQGFTSGLLRFIIIVNCRDIEMCFNFICELNFVNHNYFPFPKI